MTHPQIQIACAKACGWRDIADNPFAPNPLLCGFNDAQGKTEAANCGSRWGIPNFASSHDAMAEALGTMTEEEWKAYERHLGEGASSVIAMLIATPLQQAVAFLKTKNLYVQ